MHYKSKPYLLILIAPSGGGKSTLCDAIMEREDNFVYSISSTTRKPRGAEKHGVDYLFLNESEFMSAAADGDFIETAKVHGNWYGTSRSFINNELGKGRNIILDIDVQGALKILDSGIECVTVFLLPPNETELHRRLKERGTDTDKAIALRLENAAREVEYIECFDYLIINDELDKAVSDLQCIIRSEKLRVRRYEEIKENYYRSVNVKS